MTKAELVDLIYLNISGGEESPDVNVERGEISASLPMFISDAVAAFQNQSRNESKDDIKTYGASNGELVNSHFLTTIEVTPTLDSGRMLYYVVPPSRIQNLPLGRGLNGISPMQGNPYIPVVGRSTVVGIENKIQAFWLEHYKNEDRIYITNVGLPVCKHLLSIVVDFGSMGDEDQVSLPPGFNSFVLQSANNWYLKQRQTPSDDAQTDKDEAFDHR